MTEARRPPAELLEKAGDGDFPRAEAELPPPLIEADVPPATSARIPPQAA